MNSPVKTWKFSDFLLTGSAKNIKLLKAESVVSGNTGHHRTHIYLQHWSVQIKIIYPCRLYFMAVFIA